MILVIKEKKIEIIIKLKSKKEKKNIIIKRVANLTDCPILFSFTF